MMKFDLTFSEVLTRLSNQQVPKTLLVGNGLSISFRKQFSEFDLLHTSGILSDNRLRAICDYLEESSTESIMGMLRDLQWLTKLYEQDISFEVIRENSQKDLDEIRSRFVNAVKQTHPMASTEVSIDWRNACLRLLRSFDQIFTTNYDLLIYWAAMSSIEIRKKEFRDGFGWLPGSDRLLFQDSGRGEYKRDLWHLHGALHIFPFHGLAEKCTTSNGQKYLLDVIDAEMKVRGLPLVVLDGSGVSKERYINENSYLRCARDQFKKASGPLVTFGFGFRASDKHIWDWISSNARISELYVGVFSPDEAGIYRIQQALAEMQTVRVNHKMAPFRINLFDTNDALADGKMAA